MKYCKFCGEQIEDECVLCTKCGKQVEELKTSNAGVGIPNIIINNSSSANANATIDGDNVALREKNKWVALILCIFLGWLGAHKFYEGKIGLGILYLLTTGILGIGVIVDIIVLLFKPNPYYV